VDLKTFNQFRTLVYDRSGIALGEGKETLVSARIGKRMRTLGIQSPRAYLQYVLDQEEEIVHLLNCISTNFTSFFRENEHFDFLARTVRGWLADGQRRLRIWSAASSTGEEPYTVAMVVREAAEGREVDAKVLATDISTRVLEKAHQGVYRQEQVRTVPAALRERYFERDRPADAYRVRPALKEMTVFRRLNLSTPPFPMSGPMDVIFCRNVMIYFDKEVRRRLVAEAHRLLRPGGYLIVGHAESLTGIPNEFGNIRPSIYAKAT
jgi:chemotaxis protein methyltransferase CheR